MYIIEDTKVPGEKEPTFCNLAMVTCINGDGATVASIFLVCKLLSRM